METRRAPRRLAGWTTRLAPTGLVQRVRWLFLLFALLVLALLLLDLPRNPAPWWPDKVTAAVATLVVAGWAVLRYRRGGLPLATDVVPPLGLIVAGVASGFPFAVLGPAFVLIYFRAMFGTRLQAMVNAAMLGGAFFVALGYHEDVEAVATPGSVLLLVSFLAVGVVMQSLGSVAGQHERGTERERVLTGMSARLLRADTEPEVHRIAVEGAALLVPADKVACSLWTFTDDGQVLLAATAGAELMDLRQVPLATALDEVLQQFLEGEPFLLGPEVTRRLEDAFGTTHRFHELLVAPLLPEGRMEGLLLLASPVSLDREVLEAMRRFSHELLLGLDRTRLLAELQHANDDLRRADAVKNQFLSTVSHELRTPLTSIRGFAQTLRGRWDQLEASQREHYLDIIERQASRQQQLVEDLLTTSRILAGRLRVDPMPVSVAETATAVLEELAVPVEDYAVTADPALKAYADPLHLHQIISNLVSNAGKYGRPPIEIDAKEQDGWCVVQVRDHGPGVPEAFRGSLYEPFKQSDAVHGSGEPGVGLGLTIVRRLAVANQGTVDLRPEVTPGACFELRLPVADGRGAQRG